MHDTETHLPPEDSGLLPPKEKIAYGVGSANDAWGNWLLPSIVWPVFNIHLGLAPSLVSLALLLNRLIDAVSDPFFGWASDNTRSSFGRRRPYILVGSVLAGIAMPLFFLFLKPGWSENSYFWLLYDPDLPWLQLVASGLIAFTTAGFWMLYGALGADVLDYDELESGQRREGAFAACGSYLMKIGLAVGIGGSGYVLEWTGFDEKLGGNQTVETLNQMRIYLLGIPIAGLVLAFIFLLSFGLTRQKSEEIRDALEKHRGRVC